MAVVTITDTTVDGSGTAPDAPTSLTTEKEWDGVRLHWTNPSQRDVDYIEIWRATVNNRASATMVAQVKGNDYMDHSLETGTRYYWIRATSTTGLPGAYHPTSATAGVSGIPEQVAITSAADKDVLQYDSATSSWVNSPGLRANTRLLGEMQATGNTSYVFPTATLTTITDNNGYSAVSSFAPNTLGFGANAAYTHYYGDTLSAQNSAAALNYRAAEGNSVTGVNLPWTGTTSVAPSAIQSGIVLGTINYNGYATTGFSNDIATQYQGGGTGTSHIIQYQGYAAENLADGTLTISSANITGISSFRAPIVNLQVTGTKGQVSFNTTTPAIGQAIRMLGTLTGTATGIAGGQDYYIIATNGSTTATLSATPGGLPITTTPGNSTGLTITRCAVTLTLSGQTSFPFGRNALVTVSGITNIPNGTYPVGGITTLTSLVLGIPHSLPAPALSGTQQLSCPTVTNAAGGVRIRAVPVGVPLNPQNRLNIVDHTAATATYRADTFVIAGGAYANTGTTRATIDANKAAFAVPVAVPAYTATALNAITGAVGWTAAVSDSGGKLAYWDTTNARWSFVFDNSAV
jgi:hypothetical protein